MTNRQMFDNVVMPLKYQEDLDMYDHTVSSVMTGKNLIPVFTAAGIFVLLLGIDIWEVFRYYFYNEARKVELEDIEGLPDFPRCLDSK